MYTGANRSAKKRKSLQAEFHIDPIRSVRLALSECTFLINQPTKELSQNENTEGSVSRVFVSLRQMSEPWRM